MPCSAVPPLLRWFVDPVAVVGCLGLFALLTGTAKTVFVVWASIGLTAYYLFGYRKSHLAALATHRADAEPSPPAGLTIVVATGRQQIMMKKFGAKTPTDEILED